VKNVVFPQLCFSEKRDGLRNQKNGPGMMIFRTRFSDENEFLIRTQKKPASMRACF